MCTVPSYCACSVCGCVSEVGVLCDVCVWLCIMCVFVCGQGSSSATMPENTVHRVTLVGVCVLYC